MTNIDYNALSQTELQEIYDKKGEPRTKDGKRLLLRDKVTGFIGTRDKFYKATDFHGNDFWTLKD